MDEGAVIHEIFADPLQQAFHAGGFFAFGWQILAIPLVAIFGVAYLRFLFHLPGHMQKLFVLACGMYIGGALFADGISASQWSADTGVSMIYLSIATVEELLEMMGVVVFIYGLLRYIVEMNHLVVLGSEVAVGSSSKTGDSAVMPINNTPDQTAPKMWRLLRPSLLLIVLLIGTNIALLSWIVSNRPTELANSSTTLFYQSIDEPLAQNDVTILQIPGTYDPKNIFMRQMTSSLLSEYAEVMVVVIPPIESSYIFAGAVLPFDRDSLVELLHSDGKFEFVIFETAVVRALVGDTETPTSSG
jgi:hypothetical protein